MNPHACHLTVTIYPRLFTPYRITRSALANTFGGIVNPICFAALRLMMNSNFFGCSTGSSAGFAPFSILSTYVAARRSKSRQVDAVGHKSAVFHMFSACSCITGSRLFTASSATLCSVQHRRLEPDMILRTASARPLTAARNAGSISFGSLTRRRIEASRRTPLRRVRSLLAPARCLAG